MSARLIKAGEPLNLSTFNFQNLSSVHSAPAPALHPVNPPQFTAARTGGDGPGAAGLEEESSPSPTELIQAARAEAQRLVADAQAHSAEIERSARERGRAEALAWAQAESNLAAEELRDNLAVTLEELGRVRAELAAHAEQDLVRLALEIAKKIVHREVKVDHEIALTLARVALGRIHQRTTAIVRLHPDDYAYVRERRERLGTESTVEIVEDRSIRLGGCVVQSDLGEIDARIEQQFAEIEKNFLSA